MFHWALLLLPCFLFSNALERLNGLTLEEKVGQLFIAPICPQRGEDHWQDWNKLIHDLHIGNAIVKHADPETQITALNRLQSLSRIPLLITADAEWGLAMRMSNTIAFPRNMTLGAIQDLSLLETLGEEIGREARLVGIHMNLAPVIDVNNNPLNPIIHMRSFGENPQEVARRAHAIMTGFQKSNLLACAKHFPGHGDTGIDSHFALPLISGSLSRLETIELPPFQEAIKADIAAIMTAHILVPALDPNLPATLSLPILTNLLRNQLHFRGLIITDALNMKSLSDRYSPEEIALRARAAGADLLLYGDHIFSAVDHLLKDWIPRAYHSLLKAYQDKMLPIDKLNESVLRILTTKEKLGLFEAKTLDLNPSLHTPKALALKQRLFQEAITQVGPSFTLDPEATHLSFIASNVTFPAMPEAKQIVLSLRDLNPRAERYGLSLPLIDYLKDLSNHSQLLICLFGTPYALSLLPSNATILVAFEDDPMATEAVLQILHGNAQAKGRLPVRAAVSPN